MTISDIKREFFLGTQVHENLDTVSDPVVRSWQRLKKSGSVESSRFVKASPGGKSGLPDGLIDVLRKIGPKLRIVAGSPDECICGLFDANGVLCAFDGGEPAVRKLVGFGWANGVSFHEDVAGTNAVDLAIRYREFQKTSEGEHTNLALADVSVLGFPMLSQNGKVLGCMALLTFAVEGISNALAVTSLSSLLMQAVLEVDLSRVQLSRSFAEQRAIADAMKDGTMVVSREGILEYMNAPAGRILKVDPKRAMGRLLADVLGFDPVIAPIFETGVGYSDEEVRVKNDKTNLHLLDTAVPIKDGAGNVLSVVNTFREFGRVAQVAQKFAGNQAHYSFDSAIGRSAPMVDAVELGRRAASGGSNVLIAGESGTGKELFAQGIHLASPRASGPFVAVNCAALPRDLIEAELFGYMPGSFTGAHKSGRPGKFEIASGGTIFLDEISEMPLDVQAKLLRVLQEREVTRVGASEPISVDVRFVAAMNQDVRNLISEGRFREDLFYRINVIEITVPALRERPGDVRLLAHHYVQHYARLLNKPVTGISETILRRLEKQAWPGNVRELQNTIERMVNFADGDMIDVGLEVPSDKRVDAEGEASSPKAQLRNMPTLEQVEKKLIAEALEASGYNVTKAAEAICITKPRLYRMIEKYEIPLQRGRVH